MVGKWLFRKDFSRIYAAGPGIADSVSIELRISGLDRPKPERWHQAMIALDTGHRTARLTRGHRGLIRSLETRRPSRTGTVFACRAACLSPSDRSKNEQGRNRARRPIVALFTAACSGAANADHNDRATTRQQPLAPSKPLHLGDQRVNFRVIWPNLTSAFARNTASRHFALINRSPGSAVLPARCWQKSR
jgi:hypothetical protein